jgi:hypothetical protein
LPYVDSSQDGAGGERAFSGFRVKDERRMLRTAIGQYPHPSALRDGRISSNLVTLDFADIPTINRAFAPMVREQHFNVSEIAIATFLQAKTYGKPLVLLPVVLGLAAAPLEGADIWDGLPADSE